MYSMLEQFRRPRYFGRYLKIVRVLARHGFGSFLEELQLHKYLPFLPLFFSRSTPKDQLTPAEHFRQALEELGPAFIKLGQVLSTRPDILPRDFILQLYKLCDDVTPTPWSKIQDVLVRHYRAPLDQVFAEIDPRPLGSASLAQVHAARLQDGQSVVIKVQRPDIRRAIEADLDVLFSLARLAQRSPMGQLMQPVEIVSRFADTLRCELDYRQEGLNLERFQAQYADEKQLKVPKVIWEYSGGVVLVMERLEGIKIDDLAGLEAAGYPRAEVARLAARFIALEIMENGFFHADPHPGNFFVMGPAAQPDSAASSPRPIIGVIDFGMMGYISNTDRLNIVQSIHLATKGDTRGVVDLMLRMGAISANDNPQEFERELDRLLHQYRGLPLKHIRTGRLLQELMQLAFHHHLHLPPDLWLLFKTVIELEGLARQLDPDFDAFGEFEPHVRRIMLEKHLPWVWGPQFLNDLGSFATAARDLPSIGENLLRTVQRGEFPLSFHLGVNKDTLGRIDRMITRLSLSLLTAAFILGLALLLPVATANQWAMILVVIGFAAALSLGIWLVVSILKSGK